MKLHSLQYGPYPVFSNSWFLYKYQNQYIEVTCICTWKKRLCISPLISHRGNHIRKESMCNPVCTGWMTAVTNNFNCTYCMRVLYCNRHGKSYLWDMIGLVHCPEFFKSVLKHYRQLLIWILNMALLAVTIPPLHAGHYPLMQFQYDEGQHPQSLFYYLKCTPNLKLMRSQQSELVKSTIYFTK